MDLTGWTAEERKKKRKEQFRNYLDNNREKINKQSMKAERKRIAGMSTKEKKEYSKKKAEYLGRYLKNNPWHTEKQKFRTIARQEAKENGTTTYQEMIRLGFDNPLYFTSRERREHGMSLIQ